MNLSPEFRKPGPPRKEVVTPAGEAARRFRAKNPDYYAQRMRRLRKERPEETKAFTDRWRAAHPEEVREYGQRSTRRLRTEVLQHYGGSCACCGESEDVFLTIDHMNGGGRRHVQEISGKKIYRWLRLNGFPADFQVLCWNCNAAKYLLGVCPHLSQHEAQPA